MKRSAPKPSLADLLKQDTQPRSRTKTEDLSDDLARQFDDGTPLPGSKSTPGTGGTPGTGSTTGTGSTVAPTRDYMKVANSIHREATPSGVFRGKGKLIYDYLYSRTRGAIVPTRTVQATWGEIMKAASIGSDKTLRDQLKALRIAGLISWEWSEGSQGGSVYTVYLPEETTGTGGTTGTGSTGGTSRYFLPVVPPVESTTGTGSLSVDFQGNSADKKTSFKTNTERDDDEAFAELLARLKAAVNEVTGKVPAAADVKRWGELAELLVTELKIAAGRTENVSNVPAFLTEHLRRRLWKKDKRQLDGEGKSELVSNNLSSKVDASKCPDCFGTGMWYPEGFEKGVARCSHTKLKAEG